MQDERLKHLGRCIKAEREASRLTQEELANRTGRGLRHLQNIEAGRVNPSFEILGTYITCLGMSADELFYPDAPAIEKDVRHIMGKLLACSEDEREIIMKTLDCLADEFIHRRSSRDGSPKSE